MIEVIEPQEKGSIVAGLGVKIPTGNLADSFASPDATRRPTNAGPRDRRTFRRADDPSSASGRSVRHLALETVIGRSFLFRHKAIFRRLEEFAKILDGVAIALPLH